MGQTQPGARMARSDELADFVRTGLAAGRAPDELAGALGQAGWGPREVADALNAWAPGPAGMPPVPRPRPYVSAREALVYGLLFLLLGSICWHVAMLGFRIIDSLLPEIGELYPPPASSMRWNIATLIPTVPLFLWLNRRVATATAGDPSQRRSLVRKWFASITLLLAALALLGDVVAVVYALLDGELTLRFVAKAALIAVIGGLAFAYYRDELDER